MVSESRCGRMMFENLWPLWQHRSHSKAAWHRRGRHDPDGGGPTGNNTRLGAPDPRIRQQSEGQKRRTSQRRRINSTATAGRQRNWLDIGQCRCCLSRCNRGRRRDPSDPEASRCCVFRSTRQPAAESVVRAVLLTCRQRSSLNAGRSVGAADHVLEGLTGQQSFELSSHDGQRPLAGPGHAARDVRGQQQIGR